MRLFEMINVKIKAKVEPHSFSMLIALDSYLNPYRVDFTLEELSKNWTIINNNRSGAFLNEYFSILANVCQTEKIKNL